MRPPHPSDSDEEDAASRRPAGWTLHRHRVRPSHVDKLVWNARLDSRAARKRAGDRQKRFNRRMDEPVREEQIFFLPPNPIGGVVAAPSGVIAAVAGHPLPPPTLPVGPQAIAARVRAIVMDIERRLTGAERIADADAIMVARNEILTALNKPNADIFAMSAFPRAGSRRVRALRRPFRRAPDFGVTGATGEIAGRFTRREEPA